MAKLPTQDAPGRRVQIVLASPGVEAPAIGTATFVMLQEGLPTNRRGVAS